MKKEIRKDLFMNGVGVMAIIDNKYYIEDDEWGCYKKCTRDEFIKELKEMSWVCLTSWDEKTKQDYLDLVNYCKEVR